MGQVGERVVSNGQGAEWPRGLTSLLAPEWGWVRWGWAVARGRRHRPNGMLKPVFTKGHM